MKQSTSFAQVATNLLNVLQGYSKGIRFLLVMFLTLTVTTNAWAEDTWKLVTTISDLATGDEVVIVANSASQALSTTQNGNNRGQASVTKNTSINTVTWTGNAVQVLNLEAGKTSGTFAFYTGSGYLFAASSSKNYLRTETTLSANSSWNITIASTGVATIKATGTYTHNWLRYNSSSNIFSCYDSGQGDVCIYKKVAPVAPQTIDVTLHYKGTSTTISNQTSPYTLPTTGDYVADACDGWEFAGWHGSEYAKSETEPSYITQLASTGDAYAVYSHTAEGEGGRSTATMSSFSAVSGNVNNDANVSYAAAQGTAGTAPGVYSNEIRIYQNGGTLTITGNNGKKLTSITIGSSMKTSVSYKIDGGSESSAQSITANGKYTLSDIDATSVLFTCEGTDKNSRLYLNYLSVTYSGGQTVYYTTTPDCKPQTPTYTITWKNADGTILETDNNVESGATPQYNGATPTKAATAQYTYTFAGWDPEISTVTGDQIYTAKFTETLNKYTITWKNADGTTLKTESLKYGATPSYDGTPTKEQDAQYTYTFKGWTPTIATVTGNQTYTATYTSTIRQYAVTFDNNGHGDKPTDQNVDYNGNATNPGDLSATGYIFNGWYDNSGNPFDFENTKITGPITITAKWCEILGDAIGLSVQTDYEVNGQTYVKFSWTPADNTKSHAFKQVICIGKVGEEKKCTDLEENQVWTADLRSKLSPGEYKWTIQAIGDGTDYCDGRVIAGTNFTIVGYVVSFNTDGGDGDYNDVTVFEGETYTIPVAPTKTGYTFKGWSDGTNLYQPGAEISNLTEDLTLTAIWLTTTTLSWSAPTCTATIASPSNEFPTLSTTPADLQGVQYSSFNTDVATIDANGNIRLLTAGETTITANFVENATHAASSAKYTLTVVASDNCKWVEIDIEDIHPTDEVVVTMGNNTTVYALHNSEKLTNSPKALQVAVQNGVLVGTDFANYGWYVTNIDGGYQLQSCSDASKYLYGVASYITLGKNPTTFSIYQDQETGNECFVYIANSKLYYLNHGTEDGESAWKKVESTSYLKSNTLKFYKKECLPTNEYWVTYDLENVTCTTDPRVETVTSTSEDFEVTFAANDGYVLTDDIEVQMENGELEISWSKDKGKLTVKNPDGGFTGNITISLAACLSLPAPQNLAETDITSSSVTLTWAAVTNAQSYEVFVTDFGTQDITRSDLTECQVTISELTKNTEFTWDVRAIAEGYCGIPSELGYFQTLQTYDVTFNNNGHINAELMPATQTVDDGSLAQEPADDPSDNGYSFGGWYDNKNCEGDPFNFSETLITDNTVLYAKWNIVTYNIVYAGLEDATNHANNPVTYTIETPTITFLAPSTRDGYIFSGWNPTTLEKGSYGNKTITATWEKGKIVTWKADGNVIEQQTYASGDALVLPTEEIEACQGSVFVGWTDEENYSHATDAPTYVTAGSAVTTNAIYYAVYAEEPEGEPIEELTESYTFSSYTAGSQYAENEEHILDEDLTIYTTECHFTSELRIYSSSTHDGYVVSNKLPGKIVSMGFNAGNNNDNLVVFGSTDGSNWHEVGKIAVTKTTPYNDYSISFGATNYTYFKLDVEGSNQIRIKSMTITYMSGSGEPSAAYANYSTTCSATYRVSYDFAEGEGICTTESVKVGNDYTICADEPTKTGYTFQHWTDGTNTYEAGATIENVQSNITLTAVWEANTYTITWMANGEEYTTTTHTYDQTLEILSEPYTCYGTKTFMGWTETSSVNENGEGITYIEESTNPSEDKIYYAVFADIQHGTDEEVIIWNETFGNAGAENIAWSDDYSGFVGKTNGVTYSISTSPAIKISKKSAGKVESAIYSANAGEGYFTVAGLNTLGYSNVKLTYNLKMASTSGQICKVTVNDMNFEESSLTNNQWYEFVYSDLPAQENLSIRFSFGSSAGGNYLDEITLTGEFGDTYSNYTTSPTGCPEIEVAENVYVTSTSGQSVKVKVPVTISNYQDGITLSASIEGESNFTVANISSITEGTATLEIAYKPKDYNTTENTTVTVLTKIGENKVTATDFTITGRSLPKTFAIVAKVGNVWYALPSQGLNSTTPPVAYPVEVDNMADPTAVVSVPANADWSLRQVYKKERQDATQDRYEEFGSNIVLVNNSEPVKALNASQTGNYLLTDAQYNNYYSTNPGLYEWTPTTTDLETYTLTNAQRTDRTLNVATNTVFGVHSDNKATTEVRFLPITGRYTPAALQVVEWKENSVVIMYNGNPAQTASVSVNGGAAQETVLSSAQRDIAVYELAANGLAANPTQRLSITIGTETTILSIPYIISGSKNDIDILPGSTVAARQEVAKVSDLVILKDATLTADGAKGNPYKFRNVTVYGGGKLVVPADNGFGVNSLTLRIGGVTADGNYDYVYPEFVLNTTYDGAFTNTSGKINLDYLTTKEQYYTFVAPFEVYTKHIKYPVDIYGSNVAADNRGSFEFQYYDGAARAAGDRGWKVVDEDPTDGATLTAHKGYTFYGMPMKVSVNGGSSTRQKFGIHRIPMTETAANVMSHENSAQTVAISAHPSEKNINSGWNLIGNPYMSTIKGLNNQSIVTGTIVLVDNRWEWSNEDDQRFIVFPSNDGEWYYTLQASNATLPAFKNFFVQIIDKATNALVIPHTSRTNPSAAPARHLAEDMDKDIELAIVLEQDDKYADQMDFLLNDAYSAVYDRNADFTKMMNNTNFNLFGVHMDDYLSFVAIDTHTARSSVAIGYQVPQAGQYTLRLSDKPYVMWSMVDAIYVTDHEVTPEVTTNLLDEAYTFQVSNAETNTTRFSISIVPSKESGGTTTAVDDILHQDIQTQKFIYNDQLYILRGGVVYDAMGQRVTTINQ